VALEVRLVAFELECHELCFERFRDEGCFQQTAMSEVPIDQSHRSPYPFTMAASTLATVWYGNQANPVPPVTATVR
jgi:hypothetical protein